MISTACERSAPPGSLDRTSIGPIWIAWRRSAARLGRTAPARDLSAKSKLPSDSLASRPRLPVGVGPGGDDVPGGAGLTIRPEHRSCQQVFLVRLAPRGNVLPVSGCSRAQLRAQRSRSPVASDIVDLRALARPLRYRVVPDAEGLPGLVPQRMSDPVGAHNSGLPSGSRQLKTQGYRSHGLGVSSGRSRARCTSPAPSPSGSSGRGSPSPRATSTSSRGVSLPSRRSGSRLRYVLGAERLDAPPARPVSVGPEPSLR